MSVCTCWDIPRSDCCYCGAHDEAERLAWQESVSLWAFSELSLPWQDGMDGPLRTDREVHPGHGGCKAINPAWDPRRRSGKRYHYTRWFRATDRRYRRAEAIKARRLP